MHHPNFIDKIKLLLNSRYLYPEELCQPTSNLNVAIVHRVSNSSHWKIMDYITLKKGSIIKFLGSAKQFKFTGDLLPTHSLFEAMNISSDKLTGLGDILALTPTDRQFLTKAPEILPQNSNQPTYYTAENQ